MIFFLIIKITPKILKPMWYSLLRENINSNSVKKTLTISSAYAVIGGLSKIFMCLLRFSWPWQTFRPRASCSSIVTTAKCRIWFPQRLPQRLRNSIWKRRVNSSHGANLTNGWQQIQRRQQMISFSLFFLPMDCSIT